MMSDSNSNSSSQLGEQFTNTKESFQRCIAGASRGETTGMGLYVLSSNIGSIPTELASDAAKVFLSYLQEPSIPNPPIESLVSTGKAAMISLRKLMKADRFGMVERYLLIEFIYQNWYRKLDFTRRLLSHIRKMGDAVETNTCFEAVVDLLYIIIEYPGPNPTENLDNKSAEMLISYIWFYYPDEAQAQPTYLSLCHAISRSERTSRNYMAALFDVIEDTPGECARAEAIQRKLMDSMDRTLSIPSAPIQKWFILESNSLLITRVSDYFRDRHFESHFEQNFLSALFEGANHCVSAVSRYMHDVASTEVIYACVGILNAILRILQENPDLLRKALRLGLLQIIVSFGGRYKVESASPYKTSLITALSAHVQFITHMLDDIRVSFLVRENLKKEGPEVSLLMSLRSLVTHLWCFMEYVLRERISILRIHTIPEKIAYCDACSVKFQKSSMKRCGKCLCAIYCSRECQMKDWKEQGHRHVCDTDWVSKQMPIKKFDPKTEMPKCIALASIISYCTTELHKRVRFRPLHDLFLINSSGSNDFGNKPVHSREGFLRKVRAEHHPSLANALRSAYTHIREVCKGKGTLCITKEISTKKTVFDLFAFPMILDGAQDAPIPTLPSDGKMKMEPLPNLVVMIEEELHRSNAAHSKKRIDKVVLKMFLDKSSLGRSAWLYWLVWSRTFSIKVELD